MGDYYQTIVDIDADPDGAAATGARLIEWLVAAAVISPRRTDCVLGPAEGTSASSSGTGRP